jgi:hypothetical protein
MGNGVDGRNGLPGAADGEAHLWKTYPPDFIQPHTQWSGPAGAWLESVPTVALSQHASGPADTVNSSVQRTAQENQVPNSSTAKTDFNARTARIILAGITRVNSIYQLHS